MFSSIRQKTKSFGTYLLVSLLIVIFAVFFGGPAAECGDSKLRFRVAKVGKTTIYNEDLNIIYGRSYGFGGNTPEEQFYQQQAASLRLLITMHLLSDRASEMGLRVSDVELKDYLMDPLRNREYPYYNRNGQFSPTLYKNYVRNGLRTSPRDYEAFKRNELLASKYVDLLLMQGAATPAEVEAEARIKKTKVNLEFVKFDPTSLIDEVSVSPEQLKTFIEENAGAIQKYYEEHIADYTTPEQISVRRVFIPRPAATEGDDAVDAANQKWADAKRRILEEKEDFAKVAGDLSEDFAKDKGGLMDWTEVDNIDQDIAKAVKDAEVGSTKEIETDSSYMIVKLEGRKEKVVTPLADVRDDIATTLIREREVQGLVSKLVPAFQEAAKNAPNFADALAALKAPAKEETDKKDEKTKKQAKQKEEPPAINPKVWEAVTVDTTGDFTQAGKDLSSMFGGQFANLGITGPWDDVPKVGKSAQLIKQAFELTTESPNIAEPMLIDGSTFLFRLDSRTDPTEEELNSPQIRAQIVAAEISPFMLPVKGEFLLFAPMPNYGPLIDWTYFDAIKDKTVQFYNQKQWPASPFVVKTPPVEETAP